jgi:hypothetical protein
MNAAAGVRLGSCPLYMRKTHLTQPTPAKLIRTRSTIFALALITGGVTSASAESVPFSCTVLPQEDVASIMLTNSLASDASCIVTCKFSTTRYDDNPQITCAKPVPAGKEVEMCRLPSGGGPMVKATEGHAECTN